VQSIENTTRAIQTRYIPLRKELYGYLEDRGENDRDENRNVTTPDWNLQNSEGEIVPEDLRYFSAYDLSLNPEFEFVLTGVSLGDFVASLAPIGHRTTASRVGTNMDEMARRFKAPKSYTSVQLKQYQAKLFSVLNKRVSSSKTSQVSIKRHPLTSRSLLTLEQSTEYCKRSPNIPKTSFQS
jgi:hypothetical protein